MKFDLSLLFGSLAICGLSFFNTGCATNREPLPQAEKVDLKRFMGAWYVIGYTPIIVDKAAHNGVEHYYLNPKNEIETTYSFRDGSTAGPIKTYKPKGFVYDKENNAEWRMQFIWPFKSDYIISYLSEDYDKTIIAHPSRKYAWIMQRSPEMDDTTYDTMLTKLKSAGYDTSVVKRMPHDWSNEQTRLKKIESAGKTEPLVPR
jgi:apolipoprotein D and lipocalin family protein